MDFAEGRVVGREGEDTQNISSCGNKTFPPHITK